jgi:argininosuccinate lyase
MIQRLQVNETALRAGCASELYATDEVLRRLANGGSFRDVYKEVGMDLESVAAYDADETIRNRSSEGTTGNLGLEMQQAQVKILQQSCDSKLGNLLDSYARLSKKAANLVTW